MDQFDPYHSWLGIPPRHQPPDHYRLLGVQTFETDLDVIANAAGRQMGHVRTYQTGQHSDLSQKILNEIAKAKVCLLNPDKKASYDDRLRSKQQNQRRRDPPLTQAAPLAQAAPLQRAKAASVEPAPVVANEAGPLPIVTSSDQQRRGRAASRPSRGTAAQPAWKSPLAIAAACGTFGLLIIIVVVVSTQTSRQDPQKVAEREVEPVVEKKPQPKRSGRGGKGDSPPVERRSEEDPDPTEFDPPKPPEPNVKRVDDPDGKSDVDPPPSPQTGQQKPTAPIEPLPIETTAAKKAPVPEADAIVAAEKEIDELFVLSKSRTRDERARVAKELAGAAAEEAKNTPTHFAILSRCRDLAAKAGDLDTAMLAIKRLDAVYLIDAWKMRLSAMQSAARGVSKSDNAAVDRFVRRSRRQIDAATADDRFEIAVTLAGLASTTGRKAATDKAALVDLAESTKQLKVQFDKIAPAIRTLKTNPKDADANLAVGKFRCLNQDDWKRGLPRLAIGSDAALKAAAIADLNNPTAAKDRAKVGDAWWDMAQSARSKQQRTYLTRANRWYKQAEANLGGLKKLHVTQRLKDFEVFAVEDLKAREKAALDALLRRSEPSRGLVGTVRVDGKDAGLILTYQLGKRFDPKKLAAALARYGKKGSMVVVEFAGVVQLQTTSRLYVLNSSSRSGGRGQTQLYIPGQRRPLAQGFYHPTTLNPGVFVFRWVLAGGDLRDGLLEIQYLNNDGIKGEQVNMVYNSKMLKALKAKRAVALIDVTE